jgi:hypothetical protein
LPIAYNTPLRKLFSTVAAFLLLVALLVQAQPPQGKGKGGGKGGFKGSKAGFVPKNLQVLKAAALPDAMQSFVQALGLADKGRCSCCHVEDRASDEKVQKLTAHSGEIAALETSLGRIASRREDGGVVVNAARQIIAQRG